MLLTGKLTAFKTSFSAQTHFESIQLLLLLHSWSAGEEFHVIHPRVGDLHEQLARVRHATKALVIVVAAIGLTDTADLSVALPVRNKGLPTGDGGWLSE